VQNIFKLISSITVEVEWSGNGLTTSLFFFHVFDLAEENFVEFDLFLFIPCTGLNVFFLFLLQIPQPVVQFHVAHHQFLLILGFKILHFLLAYDAVYLVHHLVLFCFVLF
jgi:hypothetical protein